MESGLLSRAIASVGLQRLQPDAISVAVDNHRLGAPATRDRALRAVRTKWTAPLDDDDEFRPRHLEQLLHLAIETGADYVYSWFVVVGGQDPFPETHFTNPFNPDNPIETTITVLVKTELAMEVGYQPQPGRTTNTGEDWRFLLQCLKLGAKVEHLVEKTWRWHHDSGNTSGLASRW